MMSLVFGLALATTPAVDLPKLGEPIGDIAQWFNESDWTPSRVGGSVRFKVVVKPDGLPDTCTIEATTGNAEVDAFVCIRVKKRFRFKASSDANGEPVGRVFVRTVNIGRQMPDAIRPQPLFSLNVKGFEKVSRLSVVIDVNQDGSLAGCSSADRKAALISLRNTICRSLTSLWKPLPEVDGAGTPIRYVRDIPVDITHAS